MTDPVFIVDAVRTPVGKLGGVLAHVRPDDLAAHAMRSLMDRNPEVDPGLVEDVVWGAANQAGEDNRDVARIAAVSEVTFGKHHRIGQHNLATNPEYATMSEWIAPSKWKEERKGEEEDEHLRLCTTSGP